MKNAAKLAESLIRLRPMLHADTAIDPALKDGVAGRQQVVVRLPFLIRIQTAEKCAGKNLRSEKRKKAVRPSHRFRCGPGSARSRYLGPVSLFSRIRLRPLKCRKSANADAIVVLTGGQARVSEAVRLLEEGHANRLLISGVHPGTTREQLAVVTSSDDAARRKER